jgi:hypothetical protein
MNLSNMISGTILATMGVYVFWHYFQKEYWYNRLLWGFFFLIISLVGLTGVVRFGGVSKIIPLHDSLQILSGSLGATCVTVGVWGLIQRQLISVRTFWLTITVGLGLFVLLLEPQIRVFTPAVQALSLLIVILLACLGLIRRDPRSVWLIFAVMIMALATKIAPLIKINQTDFYHYTTALALICFGKATQ